MLQKSRCKWSKYFIFNLKRRISSDGQSSAHQVTNPRKPRYSTSEKYCNQRKIGLESSANNRETIVTTQPFQPEWLKQAGLCYRRLMQKHLANECKTKVKCSKCGSDRHLEMLHMERKNQQSYAKWNERRRNLEVGYIVIMTEVTHHNNWSL